jgi:hypothetical protein
VRSLGPHHDNILSITTDDNSLICRDSYFPSDPPLFDKHDALSDRP